jgi:hypothetical protein
MNKMTEMLHRARDGRRRDKTFHALQVYSSGIVKSRLVNRERKLASNASSTKSPEPL